jgi:hypothetical protein
MDRPWVSVIVPVFNGARYLKAALESVVQQADEHVEIVVADDGSTDGSRDIIAALQCCGSVVSIEGTRKGNWVANTNWAVSQSSGRLITFLHQDDLWLRGRYDWIRRATQQYPNCTLWLGPTRFVDASGRMIGTWRLPMHSYDGIVEQERFLEHLLVQNFVGMPSPIFTRAAFEQVGGMDEQLWFTADWDLWLKLGALAPVSFSSEPTTGFRLHALSQTITRAASVDEIRSQIDVVRTRHLSNLEGKPCQQAVARAGHFARNLNISIACAVSGQPIRWRELFRSTLHLGIAGAYRFLRAARIMERSFARLRAGLAFR